MGGKKNIGGVNSKKEAGQQRKKDAADAKTAEARKAAEAVEEKEWEKGSNIKRSSRDEAAALKADEAERKRREKAELLKAEEEAMGGTVKKKAPGGAAKKKNKAKKNDLALLEDALQSAADKKVRKKRDELQKMEEEEAKRQQIKNEEKQKPLDPLLANTENMLGDADMTNEDGVGRQANIKRMEDEGASGIDAALGSLNVSTDTPAKSAKALYNEFESRMLPQVKEDYPGLRLTQYKEKVWQLWKKSPENPANQLPPS